MTLIGSNRSQRVGSCSYAHVDAFFNSLNFSASNTERCSEMGGQQITFF